MFGVGAGARTLDATNNKLTTFSPQLAQLSNLSRLVLTSNQIQEVPAAVLQLQFLKVRLADDLDPSPPAGSKRPRFDVRVGSAARSECLLSSRLRS